MNNKFGKDSLLIHGKHNKFGKDSLLIHGKLIIIGLKLVMIHNAIFAQERTWTLRTLLLFN